MRGADELQGYAKSLKATDYSESFRAEIHVRKSDSKVTGK